MVPNAVKAGAILPNQAPTVEKVPEAKKLWILESYRSIAFLNRREWNPW